MFELPHFMHQACPIGCDIGDGRVRLVQAIGLAPLRLAVAEAPIPSPMDAAGRETLVRTLRQLLRSGAFRGRRAVAMAPNDRIWYRRMRLAPMPDEELPAAAHWRAAREMSIRSDTFTSSTVRLATVRDGGAQVEAITVGADTSVLEEHTRLLMQAGLQPVAIDVRAFALGRALSGAPARPREGTLLILDVGHAHTDMVVAAAGVTLFLHRFAGGARRIEEIAEQKAGSSWHGIPDPSATDGVRDRALEEAGRIFGREAAREVALSLHYFATVLGGVMPQVASIGGLLPLSSPVVGTIAELVRVDIVPADELLDPAWAASLAAGSADPVACLPAAGASLHNAAAAAERQAA